MLKDFDDPDAFDETLAITEESVAEQAKANEHIGDSPMSLGEALDKIERLKERCGTLSTGRLDAMRLADEWQSKFYDELKKNNITDEMIDAAALWANAQSCGTDAWDGAWTVLAALHIYRCGGCGGQGHLDQEPQTGGVYPELEPKCPDCNGHGWTREKE